MKEKFSFDTVKDFDKHISNSVSDYKSIPDLIVRLSSYFIEKGSNVYDLGCSTGYLLGLLSAYCEVEDVSFVGYDISKNLLPKKPFSNTNFFCRDITDPKIKFFNTNLILSVFTLQFIERAKREVLVKKVFDSLNEGGAFIVCEKIYMPTGKTQDIFNFCHYDFKQRTFSPEEILEKQKTLREIMRPLSDDENGCMFVKAGFHKVIPFWQSLNFKGYLLIK